MPEQDEDTLLEAARIEAEAIVQEAKEQARLLLEAADVRRNSAGIDTDQIRSAGVELAQSIEKSIALLNQVLEELRAQLD